MRQRRQRWSLTRPRATPAATDVARARRGDVPYAAQYGRNFHDFLKDGPVDFVEVRDGSKRLYKYAYPKDGCDDILDFRLGRGDHDSGKLVEKPLSGPPEQGQLLELVKNVSKSAAVHHVSARVLSVQFGTDRRHPTRRVSTGRVRVQWLYEL